MHTRRYFLLGSALAGATHAREPQPSLPSDLDWSGARLLDAFVKARSSLRDEFTIGWMDASTYAVIGGETMPLYRLLAATWQRHRRKGPKEFEGQSLEVAFYLDFKTGARLETLDMPRTGTRVNVPNYRSGPSAGRIVLTEQARDEFRMARETAAGSSFFSTGTSIREQYLSQPQRDGEDFIVRQTLGARVMPAGADKPAFFYHEWTLNRAPWRDIVDARVPSCPVEVQYSSIAAFRPWMQMQSVDGHTLQNGRGGKVWRAAQLPRRLLALCEEFHPDLIADPAAVFAGKPAS
jgi:hypothetical protein